MAEAVCVLNENFDFISINPAFSRMTGYAVEETGGGWVDQAARSQEQIQGLRRQAAQAAPDDPFALSEERIDALSKQHDVILY